MPPSPLIPFRLLLLTALAAGAPLARAQHFLVVVDPSGKPQLVRAAVVPDENKTSAVATRVTANVEIADKNGALQIVQSSNFRFPPAPVWSPGVIDVAHLPVEIEAGQGLVHAHGYVKSDTALSNCYIVIVASSPVKGGPPDKEIFFYPVPDTGSQIKMPAGEVIPFEHEWALQPQFDDAAGTYELHFFSDGMEIPTTQMKPEEIAAARAKTEGYLLRAHPDSPIALVTGVKPIYPDELKAKNLAGSATLHCRVDRDGNVAAANVVSATDPAFGRAAVAAVRQWKFAPAVSNHHYVEQVVEFPVNFAAPNP
jgi:TonB family protein